MIKLMEKLAAVLAIVVVFIPVMAIITLDEIICSYRNRR